jgi:FixJ family two-component response regulator
MVKGMIYLVDDNSAFRSSTRWLLESHDFEVQAFADGPAFIAHYHPEKCTRPECLLLDIRMPQMSGLQLQETLRANRVGIPIVFLTAHADIPLAVETMRKGAVDFLEKPFAERALLDAVQSALRSGQPRSGAGELNDTDRLQGLSVIDGLTTRERQVLELVLDGKYNKNIGDVLGISIKTVELHRARLMEKMQAKSLAELVQKTMRGRAQ